jgi:ABC-type phosphate transport system auxiliary subunit
MRLLLLFIAFFALASPLAAQSVNCPVGYVCLAQATANEVFSKLNELAAAREALIKLQAERVASDAVIASAQKLIDDYKALDEANKGIIAKHEQVEALYQKTIQLYSDMVEKLVAKINAPKSAFQKFVTALKEIGLLAAGIALGRGL